MYHNKHAIKIEIACSLNIFMLGEMDISLLHFHFNF